MERRARAWVTIGTVTSMSVAVLAMTRAFAHHAPMPPASVAPPAPIAERAIAADAGEADEDDRGYDFRIPTGQPPALSCEDARRVITQVQTTLAYEPDAVSPHAFAAATADWLDPHGLWSASPDAPTAARIAKRAPELLAEIEGRTLDDCPAARDVGAEVARWVHDLRATFDRAREASGATDAGAASEAVSFDATSRPATQLAKELGERVGAFARGLGPSAAPYVDAARAHFFPELDADAWGRVVLAAAVRAYVPLVDPHGAWAPLDEEQSVYEVDLAGHPPPRLWERSERTAIGLRLEDGATPPLVPGDLLLSLAGVSTGGLPLEQLDQLSFAAAEQPEVDAVVLRTGERVPRHVTIGVQDEPDAEGAADDRGGLPIDRVAYGGGDALVVAIHDVRDDLGDELAQTLQRERHAGPRPVTGVVLDLRGNGGGSTDGAIAALGLFLPGAPLFPMRRRDGTIETDRAPEPPAADRWSGPVATLVDGGTASAAEMIAGALAVYHRGPSVGAPTYGKGCAQEYLDDDAHAGVLRLTTLLYALPDGAPVQRVGITPQVSISLATTAGDLDPDEREATLAHAPPTWRGPDVRDRRASAVDEAWPANAGSLGPCKDSDVCRALRALGGASAKRTVAKH